MFKTTSSGGSTARCSLSTLLILAFIGMMFSSLALAQPLPKHGIAVAKACIDEVRTCQTDLDCSDNLCLPSTCNLSIPDTTYCEITVSYNDEFDDNVTIDEAWDVMDAITLGNPGGDEVRIPAAGNLPIAFISGDTTCTVGGSLPCDIGPGGGLIQPGSVTFASNEYMPQPGDVSPLPDKAFTLATDKCDGIPDGNCSVAQKEASSVAQLDIVDGCIPQDPVICPPDDDSCTEDFECDPATGLCPDPGPRTVCPPDDDSCTEDFECDPATGLCPDPGPRTVCPPDDDSCTEDFECDPATGLCPDPGPRTVCPPDDDSCTEDFECDPATGLCPDPGPRTVCPPDDDSCTEDFECDPATGLCPDPGPRTVCPPDDDSCTEDFECDPATGLCPDPGPRTVCPPDDDSCTEDFECDPATGLCPDPGPRTVCPPDDDSCTEDFECDPATGLCPDPGPRTVCPPDDDSCTEDFECDPATGLCPDPGPRTVCPPDDDSCTEDFECDPATGLCPDPGPRTVCPPDDDSCTEDFECDPATGLCPDPGPRTVCPPDDDACTEDFECDPATGLCPDPGPRTVCPPDDDACTEDFECDPATGLCPDPGPRTVCPPDDDACTEDFECDPATGLCPDPGPREVCVDDVCQICDPTSGLCVDRDPYPGECSDLEICRTPGFWKSHGGEEKNRSTNITQEVIDSVGYLEVCGDQITNTDAGALWGLNDASAIEAMCTSPKGTLERQLVRQLTAAALNCVMSGASDGACTDTGRAELLSDCNTACTGGLSIRSVNECIDEIDCFNNGGTWDGVSCLTGVGYCEGTDDPGPIVVCWDGNECARDAVCIHSMETCHDRELCLEDSDLCFTPPGPAGSSGECKLAKKNEIFYPY